MRALKHLLTALFCVALAGGISFVWHEWQSPVQAQAPSDIAASDGAGPPMPPPLESPDARLAGLTDRGDGARLLRPAAAMETLLRVAFADNDTLIVSATSTEQGFLTYRLTALSLTTRAPAEVMEGPVARYASSHRPANKNADRFCYAQDTYGDKSDVWCSDHAWKKPRQLTTHDGPEDLIEPSISPDGSWVVFEVNTDRANRRRGKPMSPVELGHGASTVWKIGLNGAGLQQLTRGADDRRPAWSEDGQRVYFQRRLSDPASPDWLRGTGGNWDIYTVSADGSNPEPLLTTYDQNEEWPDRVPRSGKIAAAVTTRDGASRLKIIDIDTKAAAFLTDAANGPVSSVSVSPDGKLIAFLAPADPADPSRLGIWLRPIE